MILTPQQKSQLGSRPRVVPQSVPAPYTGWNTRDALDEMQPTDAILLDNWYPDTGGVNVRNGSQVYATKVGGTAVRTLCEHNANGTQRFIAAASGGLYDVTGGGTIGLPLASGFNSDVWQTVSFLGHTFFCNGVDPVQIFDGTTMSAASFSGVSTSTLVGVAVYQGGLYFWENNSTGFWFAELLSISGTLTFFDLSVVSPKGGDLIAVTTTTHDGGNGVFDFITFCMSSGVCIHYLGNDPSLLADWQLIGIYTIAAPLGPRSVCQYGAESFLTTADDHVPLQQALVALKVGQLPPRSMVSTAVQQAVLANRNAFGWQALYYPAGRRLIFNIPNPDGTFSQHVCNTALPAQPWCRFVGMNSYCWGLFNNQLFFGSASGVIYRADIGTLDGSAAIVANAQQAWNSFGQPVRKKVSACRPLLQSPGNAMFNFGLGFDYQPIETEVIGNEIVQGTPWNISPWNTSPWSPIFPPIDTRWRIGGGSGQAIGFSLSVANNASLTWLRTDFRYEPGTNL